MEISFWGVRGSIPSPGPEFNHYGGNTSCVAVRTCKDSLIILDAGTGIIALGQSLLPQGFALGQNWATVLLTHTHWDHIQGFPFFAPIFIRGNRFDIFGPSDSPAMVEGILEGQMIPHFSPVHSLRNLGATIHFRALQDHNTLIMDGCTITAIRVPHGRSSALAFRIEEQDCSLVYAPDISYPENSPPASAIKELFWQTTYLIHDTNYSDEDQPARRNRGHSSVADAAHLATLCQAQTLVMFHYDQDYSDAKVDKLKNQCREHLDLNPQGRQIKLLAAREGLTLR
jgi:phosphoribosyl 1,2-cyclic phosphodiesterase